MNIVHFRVHLSTYISLLYIKLHIFQTKLFIGYIHAYVQYMHDSWHGQLPTSSKSTVVEKQTSWLVIPGFLKHICFI